MEDLTRKAGEVFEIRRLGILCADEQDPEDEDQPQGQPEPQPGQQPPPEQPDQGDQDQGDDEEPSESEDEGDGTPEGESPPRQPGEMTAEEAERLLDAIDENPEDVNRRRAAATGRRPRKPW